MGIVTGVNGDVIIGILWWLSGDFLCRFPVNFIWIKPAKNDLYGFNGQGNFLWDFYGGFIGTKPVISGYNCRVVSLGMCWRYTVHSLSCRSWPHLASCNLSPILQFVFPWHPQSSNFHGLEHQFAYEITRNPPQSHYSHDDHQSLFQIPYGNSHIPIYVSMVAWWYPHDPKIWCDWQGYMYADCPTERVVEKQVEATKQTLRWWESGHGS